MEEEPYQARAFRPDTQVWEKAMRNVEELRKSRDSGIVKDTLAELEQVCTNGENIIPPMMKVVQSYATIGEVGDVFRRVFSIWKPPIPI
jgi:methylmalonyl-CoA mutase N-terminal domain/subunit